MRHGLIAVGLVSAMVLASLAVHAQERPLPSADVFFAAARERLASNALLQRRYIFKERRTELKLNPFGQMGTGVVEVFQVFPAVDDDMTYRRLIERDGRPVPADEVARQDREYGERYADWQRDLAGEGADDREARARREETTRRKEQAQAKELINLFDFTIVRREQLDGDPAIVVRFTPNPNARPSSREARVAYVFSGEAWVHEHEFEVMKLEGTSGASVAFGWGMIARLNEGATVLMTRKRTHGVWLPAETKFSGGGRALVVRKVAIDYSRQYFDYTPFDPTVPPPIPGLAASGKRSGQ
jgi:hypothetical protein